MSLEGKTVIVTGSAGGLGEHVAKAYLNKGSNVVICDINTQRLEPLSDSYETSFPGKTLVKQVNVSDEESVKELVAATVEKFGSLDIVVNNAGVMDHFDPAGSCDKGMWDRVLAVNLTGPFLMTKHGVQIMEKKGSGLVINVGSNASFRGFAGGVAYTASKHGIVALTKNTATFYGRRGVSSFALLLGAMETTNISEAFADGMNMEGFNLTQETQPGYVRGKTGLSTDHVANYMVFLSEENLGASSNGSCIVLNSNWPVA
ncbi:short chain dehydrogenase [Dactylonectria estremocensis]|uniref:Short chain dehydrogenase n=1 Tax=Dactylonectria estremocensis TaxID=1079267 RepID=A0A9P9EPD1_9HYPO|nr:short chain dehydrogenase [Dactylonectria estremocensis]